MSERLFTLGAARLELAREECGRFGHDFQVIVEAGGGSPVHVVCQRCGRSWRCEREVPEP